MSAPFDEKHIDVDSGDVKRIDTESGDEKVPQVTSGDLEKSDLASLQDETARSIDTDTFKHAKSLGVSKIERVKSHMLHNSAIKWIFAGSIFLTAILKALDSSTTYNYTPIATSAFNHHSMLSTVQIATSIISAVVQPFVAKFSDLTSRSIMYVVVLVFYTVGYIITACSPNITAYVVGSVLVAVGNSGLALLNEIIVADLTSLKWRGLMGSVLATPYLFTTWIGGYIADRMINSNWRWGYGMFCILIPATLAPAIAIMFAIDIRAEREGIKSITANPLVEKRKKFWSWTTISTALIEIDAFGLLLLGFAFSLLLLPFSLYTTAANGWKNPSLIAMFVVGGILFIAYCLYESLWAPFPSMPKRVLLNRTFIMCVIIDFVYMLAGYIRLLYFSSYTLVITNWSYQNWSYFNNTMTMGLCFFGVIIGIIHRITHRYKLYQILGLCVKIIGMGLFVMLSTQGPSNAVLISSVIIDSLGSAFSVVATRVAAQACVPHQDMATTISLLSLYSDIGTAIGSAIAAPIWSSKLPHYLKENLPKSANQTDIDTFFSDITSVYNLPWNSEMREGAIKAYNATVYYLFVPALGLTFISLIAACFQTDFYLGNQLNAVEGEQPTEEEIKRTENENAPLKWTDKIAEFFNRPLR